MITAADEVRLDVDNLGGTVRLCCTVCGVDQTISKHAFGQRFPGMSWDEAEEALRKHWRSHVDGLSAPALAIGG